MRCGGRWGGSPLKGFSEFFFSQRIKRQHLMFSVAVRSSLVPILSQVQLWSVSMVKRYEVMSSRWSSHF